MTNDPTDGRHARVGTASGGVLGNGSTGHAEIGRSPLAVVAGPAVRLTAAPTTHPDADATQLVVIAGPAVRLTATALLTRPPRAPAPPSPPTAPPTADPAAAPAPEAPQPAAGGNSWLVPLLVLIIGMFMSILDVSIVNIAIANIRADFGATIDHAQWISTAYSLTEGAIVPVSAWAGARLGHKRLYVWALVLFTVFSALCGLSTSLNEMILWRICQAIPGGMIPVTCIILIYRMVPPARIGAAMGLFGLGVVVAPGIGPTLGGYLVEYVSWPWIYWVNLPIGVIGVVLALMFLPGERGEPGKPFDLWGFVCIAGGLFSFLLALEEGARWGWTSYRVLGLLAFAVNMMIMWVIIELQVKNPLLDVRVFRNATFAKSVTLIGIIFVGMFAMLFYLPQFLQNVQGKTPSHTGLIVLPQALVLMVLMPVAGQLYDRIGARWPAVCGTLLAGSGLLLLSGLNTDIPRSSVILGECLVSGGVGLAMMPTMTGGLSALSRELGDSGSALNTLVQRVSQSFGTALLTAMVLADNPQFFSDRSAVLGWQGADADASVTGVVNQGAGSLIGLWQQYSNKAQTLSYSKAFEVAGWVVLFGAVVAFTLPGGRPAAGADKPAAH